MSNRALVICDGGGIGDSLLASLVGRALHTRYDAVDALTLPAHRDTLEHVPDIDRVIVDRAEPLLTLAASLARERYAAAVVTWATLRTALLPIFARIPIRVGQSRRLYSSCFTHSVTVLSELGDVTTHWSQILLNYARAIDCDAADAQPRFDTTPSDDAQAAQITGQFGSANAYAVLHPTCSISPHRRAWPLEGWIALTRAIVRRYGYKMFISGSMADESLAQRVALEAGAISLAGKTSIGGLAAVVKRAKFFVAMHSGPMHVAAAIGTPTVAIFPLQADFPDRWFPLGRAVAVVRPSYPCRAGERMENCPDYACVRNLSIPDVLEALHGLSSHFAES